MASANEGCVNHLGEIFRGIFSNKEETDDVLVITFSCMLWVPLHVVQLQQCCTKVVGHVGLVPFFWTAHGGLRRNKVWKLAQLLSAFLALLVTIPAPGPLNNALLCSLVNCVCPYCLLIICPSCSENCKREGCSSEKQRWKAAIEVREKKNLFCFEIGLLGHPTHIIQLCCVYTGLYMTSSRTLWHISCDILKHTFSFCRC